MAVFEDFISCKLRLLFPPVIDTTTTTTGTAAAAGTTGAAAAGSGSTTLGKCETEFMKKFVGDVAELGMKYMNCAKNCAKDDEACAKACIPTGSIEVQGLHNCRFNIVPKVEVKAAEGGATTVKKSTTTAGTTAAGTAPTTTAAAGGGGATTSTTSNDQGFKPPGETDDCYKMRISIFAGTDNDLKEKFTGFLKCLMKSTLVDCASFTSIPEIADYYGCLKKNLFKPAAPTDATKVITGATNSTSTTNTGTGSGTTAAGGSTTGSTIAADVCIPIRDEIFRSPNVKAQNDFINLFQCIGLCNEQACVDACAKGVQTEVVQKYVQCKSSTDKLINMTPAACQAIWGKFTTGAKFTISTLSACLKQVALNDQSERNADALTACLDAAKTDAIANSLINCVSQATPKPAPPVTDGTGNAPVATWDLSRACEPIKVMNVPECLPFYQKVADERTKFDLGLFLDLTKWCNEVNDDLCVDELQKKFVTTPAGSDVVACLRKTIRIPTSAPQPCLDY